MYAIDSAEFKAMKKECDGYCTLCNLIIPGIAEPLAENVYCGNCENRAVVGMEIGLKKGLFKLVEVVKNG